MSIDTQKKKILNRRLVLFISILFCFLENEIFILYNSLYTYLLPFLKKSCLTVDCGTIVADIAAKFTIISSIPAFSDTKVMLFNFFVINQGINIK